MTKHFPLTRAASEKLAFNIRALICETLMGWGSRAAPVGYHPQIMVEAVEAGVEKGYAHGYIDALKNGPRP